ncbi:HNH endonuclease [Paenibacillus graminis]|uniref:HNH endonuclease n=1 Tax=Paenibacillus graminis TaxID=189425 RepID=UPI002DBE9D2E|nr:AP2 domain-containing protein [Paenibacillus graminis]MEC0171677.1 AP2 domain-containing protein [Paenibacillus graminis]
MKNKYFVEGEEVHIFLSSKKYGDMKTRVSKSKFDLLSEIVSSWYPKWDKHTKGFYVYGKINTEEKQKEVSLHRVITGAQKGTEVDHVNHDTLDNTDQNLRLVSVSDNQKNRKSANVSSKSGIRNVHWHKATGNWEVQVKLNGKKIYIGTYKDIEDAKKAALKARIKYFQDNKAI